MRIRPILAAIFLMSAVAHAGSFGDNVAYQPDDAAPPKVLSSKLSVAGADNNRLGITHVQVSTALDNDPALKSDLRSDGLGSLWTAATDDPETEKKIYDYIWQNYRKVPKEDAQEIAGSIVTSAKEFLIDPFLITALIERESSFQKRAVSYHGAQGLGQLMPFNLKGLEVADGFNISQNVRGTTIYVKNLMDNWAKVPGKSLELTLASYNEGPNAIRLQNNTWKDKTGRYVRDIVGIYKKFIGSNDLEAQTKVADEE